jgi:hypothetical protein
MRLASARRAAEIRLGPRGKLSDFIQRFDSIRPGEVVDLWNPVSGSERSKNLDESEAWLRLAVEAAGARVGRVTPYTGSRYVGSLPAELREAARRAKRKGRRLVAETLDRFVRVPIERRVQAITRADLRNLRSHTLRAGLVTFLDPNATQKEVRAHRTERGQWAKGNRGGSRPRRHYRPRLSQAKLVKLKRLRRRGRSLAELAEIFDRPRATIQSLLNRSDGAV